VIGFARRRRGVQARRSDPRNEHELQRLFDSRCADRVLGQGHPRDLAGKALVASCWKLPGATARHVVFLENYDMRIGALMTRGADIWLNNPRRPLEPRGRRA